MFRPFVFAAALSGMSAVGMGAFGAHALRSRLAPAMMGAYQTAVLYHLVHTLALLSVTALAPRPMPTSLTVAAWAFLAGILLFCGSLYALSLSGMRMLGAITPVGGVVWLVAWGAMAVWAVTEP